MDFIRFFKKLTNSLFYLLNRNDDGFGDDPVSKEGVHEEE